MVTLYGIHNCDTVKKAKRWLDEHNIEYQYHDFRKDGLDQSMVNGWLEQVPLDKLVNKRSTTWKQMDEADKKALSADNAAAFCSTNETLIKRPVLDINGTVHVGFSDKIYTDLFQ